jgi:hypothetical protein
MYYVTPCTPCFISLCNINIRSIRNKMEFLETSLNDFDILVVTETHLDNQINDSDITLDSFLNIIHRKDRSNSGGELLIYCRVRPPLDPPLLLRMLIVSSNQYLYVLHNKKD